MGNCSYCGQSAGLFRKKHSECETKRNDGWNEMLTLTTNSVLEETPLSYVKPRLTEIAKASFIPTSRMQEALIYGWELAVHHFLEDGRLDESEEERLAKFQTYFSLSQDQLDKQGMFTRLSRGKILRNLMNGIIPDLDYVQRDLPFNFQKTEKLVWLFQEALYYEDRKRRQYVGGSHGVSIRVVKGLYYRVGAFKGEAVETTETVFVGSGLLGVTNRHLYFNSESKSFRIRHDKIVSIEPYSDGVVVHRDAQTAKPQRFITGDGWFTYNLLMNVSQL